MAKHGGKDGEPRVVTGEDREEPELPVTDSVDSESDDCDEYEDAFKTKRHRYSSHYKYEWEKDSMLKKWASN
jgi:hypothetical protein